MRRIGLLGILVLLIGFGAVPVQAANVLDLKTEYSAASTIGSGEKAQHGRLWRTPVALRHEMTDGRQPQTVIARLDRKLAWVLLPEQMLAIEVGLENFGLPVELLAGGGGVTQTPVGQETIAGMRTTKVHVEREAQSGPRFDGYVWTTAEGIIMKLTGTGENNGRQGAVDVSFRDVKIGRQDPSLFELPAGYRRMALVGVDFETLMAGINQFKNLSFPKLNRASPSR